MIPSLVLMRESAFLIKMVQDTASVEKAFLETTVSTETPVKAIPVRTGEPVKPRL